jgi:hypothetical protein
MFPVTYKALYRLVEMVQFAVPFFGEEYGPPKPGEYFVCLLQQNGHTVAWARMQVNEEVLEDTDFNLAGWIDIELRAKCMEYLRQHLAEERV